MSQVRYHTFSAFIILWQIFSVAVTQPCRSEYSIYGMMLKRHIFNKTKAANWPKCVQACENDVRCQSINYVISESMCELNNRTKEARPEDFVSGGDRAYMTRFERGIFRACIIDLIHQWRWINYSFIFILISLPSLILE